MEQQHKSNPNTQYMRQPSATGGFLPEKFWGVNKYDAPAVMNGPMSTICNMSFGVFEPSPIIATAGWPALISGALNVLLHLACLTLTTIYAAMHLPPPGANGPGLKDYTPHHDIDFVRSWIVVMVTTEWLCVMITVFYYGCTFKAMSLPIMAHIGLGLQLIATVSAIKLSIWVAIATEDDKANLNHEGDGLIVSVMYLGLCVIAGYIMTPISGNYYKIVTNNLKKEDNPGAESWASTKA